MTDCFKGEYLDLVKKYLQAWICDLPTKRAFTGTSKDGAGKDRGEGVLPQSGIIFQHAIMNLPASAVEFLDAFRGSFSEELWHNQRLPLVHVYTFARNCDNDEGIVSRLGHPQCFGFMA